MENQNHNKIFNYKRFPTEMRWKDFVVSEESILSLRLQVSLIRATRTKWLSTLYRTTQTTIQNYTASDFITQKLVSITFYLVLSKAEIMTFTYFFTFKL